MSETSRAVLGGLPGVGRAVEYVASAVSVVRTAVAWTVGTAVVAGWLFFWANLSWLHLSRGQLAGAALSGVPVVAALAFVAWRVARVVGVGPGGG